MPRKAANDPTDDVGLISPKTDPGDDVGLISPKITPADGGVATEATEEHGGDQSMVDTGAPTLADGHDAIVEEGPGMGTAADMGPMGDPGDLSAFGRSAGLPDDLGIGDDPALDDLTNPGGDLGSSLLDDLAGDMSDPTDGFDGMSDASGQPVFDDPTGRAMDGGDDYTSGDFFEAHRDLVTAASDAYEAGNDALGDEMMAGAATALGEGFVHHAREIAEAAEESGSGSGTEADPIVIDSGDPITPGDDDDDDDDKERQGEGGDDGTSGTQSTPIPPEADDGTGGGDGGELDPSIGGDVDPAPETEEHGGGALIGGRGDIDFDPDLDDAGSETIDAEMLGLGAVDPLEGESTLLGGDEGDLAEMTADADLGGDIEIDFDDSLADADIGEDA